MTRLDWSGSDYEVGIDRGVFYPKSGPGEPWNGIISVEESESGSKENVRYNDGVKTYRRRRSGYFSGTIKTFSYPSSFYENVLTQRKPKTFGLSYRILGEDSCKIHLVYNVLVDPTQISYGQTERAGVLQCGFTSLPVSVPNAGVSAHLIIDTSIAYSWTISDLEDILYGTSEELARLPSPEEVFSVFEDNSILKVIDHGDGSFTVDGPDEAITMLDSTTFEISWPSAIYIDNNSYKISSL